MTTALPSRLGVLGDVHANLAALTSALQFLRAEGVDRVLSVGDVVDGPGDVDRVVAMLREADVCAVRGNHERWLLTDQLRTLRHATDRRALGRDTLAWLSSLRPLQRVDTAAGEVLLGHGLGSQDMVRVTDDNPLHVDRDDPTFARFFGEAAGCAFALGGHTHRRMVRPLGDVTLVNAGTLVPDDDPCVLVLDLAARAATFHDLVNDRVVASPWQRTAL